MCQGAPVLPQGKPVTQEEPELLPPLPQGPPVSGPRQQLLHEVCLKNLRVGLPWWSSG